MVHCKCCKIVHLSRGQLQLLMLTKAPVIPQSWFPEMIAVHCLVFEGSVHHACPETLKL